MAEAGERGTDVLGDTIAETVLPGITAQVGKR